MRKIIRGGVVLIVMFAAGAASAIALDLDYHWTNSYASTNGKISAIWGAVVSEACAAADAAIGLPAGTCAAAMDPCSPGTVLSLTCQDDGTTDVAIGFKFGGDWTPDATP